MKRKFWVLGLIIIITSIASITINAIKINEEAKKAAEIEMVNKMNVALVSFSKWVNEKIVMLDTTKEIIQNLDYQTLIEHDKFNEYLQIGMDDSLVSVAYIGLKDGTFLTGDNWVVPDNYDARTRDWYKKAVTENKTTISDFYIDAATGENSITISSPLSVDGHFIGVIAIDILAPDLNAKLNQLDLNDNTYAYLFARNGIVIGHTSRTDWIGRNFYEIDEISDPAIIGSVFETQVDNMVYRVNNEEVFAVVRTIPEADWLIGIAMKSKDFFNLYYIPEDTLLINLFFLILIASTIRLIYLYERSLVQSNLALESNNEELSKAYHTINEINEKLDYKSKIDAMTTINNRGYFNETMESFWNRALVEKKEISMIMFDIDFFKNYNDYYGHVQGDIAIKKICTLISEALDTGSFFARYGGEEFVIIHYDQPLEKALEIASELVTLVSQSKLEHKSAPLGKVTISAGVNSIIPVAESTIGQFIYHTDIAMYQAKEKGKNQAILYGQLDS